MKHIIGLVLIILIQQDAFAQRDTLFLLDGEIIPCTIGRVGINNYSHLAKGASGYEKIKKTEVADYVFGDDFFVMNENKRFQAEEVINLDGYTKEEIYAALIDWIMTNQRIFLEDELHYTNDEHAIVLGTLYTKEFFNLDLVTVLDAAEGNVNTYYIKYDVIIRAKDDRLKICIDNVSVVSSRDLSYERNYSDLYRRRVNKKGLPTNNLTVIREVKSIMIEQLKTIEDHVIYVRNYGTYEKNLINRLLNDDNW